MMRVLVAQSCLTLCDPRTVACQAALSMGFSRQEYWSGLPFPSPGIFLTQELNPGLLHYRQILYHLSYQGSQVRGSTAFFLFPMILSSVHDGNP